MSEGKTRRERIQLIDAARGLCIILMICYHFAYDLYLFGLLPERVLFSPLLNMLEPLFAGLFIVIAGLSSRLSRSNLKRGAIVFACGIAVSVVTIPFGTPIYFGILHFLGAAMMLYGLAVPVLRRVPERVQPFLYGILFVLFYNLFPLETSQSWLFWLGLRDDGFVSYDYFPLLPWLFLFLFGTWLGGIVAQRRLPGWFYTLKIPLLPAVGRKSLIIFMLHQPPLYGLAYLIYRFF